jgi:hypothetical protein
MSVLCAVVLTGGLAVDALAARYEGEASKLAGFVTTSRFGKNPSYIGWKVASGGRGVNLSYCPKGSMTWSNVAGGTGGARTLTMQFANGGAEAIRAIDLYVNGTKVTTFNTRSARSHCSRFDAWWGTCGLQRMSATVNLNAGANTVRLVSPDEDGVHVDFIEVN